MLPPPFIRAATLFAVCAPFVPAQNPDGPYWNAYLAPAQIISVNALGTTAVIQTQTDVHLYSGLLRRWVVQPASASARLFLTNRYCIIQDGLTIHAFSSVTAQVQTLQVSANAVLDVGSLSSSWTACVVDGTSAWGYSSFFGQWVPLQLPNAHTFLGLSSHSIVLADGAAVHAFSAFFGAWVSTPARAGASYSAFRNGGVALLPGPDEVKAFSSYQNSWSTTPLPGAPTAAINAQDGYVLFTQGTETVFFSTLTGTLQRRSFGAPPLLYVGPNALVIQTASGVTGYAPGTDAMVPLPLPGPGGVRVAAGSFGAYAIVDDGARLTAFCGLSGRVAPGPTGSYQLTLGDTAAFARDSASGPGYAYSALESAWVPAPSVQILDVKANFEVVLLTTSTGYEAFSARKLNWSSLQSSGAPVYLAQGALVAVVDGGGIDAFDPRLGRWDRVATGAQAVMQVHRLTGVAHDGVTAWGYSLFHNTWESIPLVGAVTAYRANSSIGFVQTPLFIYVFTANGSLSNFSRFPEFSRFVTRGGTLVHLQAGTPGNAVVGLFGPRDAELSLPPYGTLRVDPTSMVVLPLGTIPAGGMLRTTFQVPPDLSLNGVTVHMQDLVVTQSAQVFLTNSASPVLW